MCVCVYACVYVCVCVPMPSIDVVLLAYVPFHLPSPHLIDHHPICPFQWAPTHTCAGLRVYGPEVVFND